MATTPIHFGRVVSIDYEVFDAADGQRLVGSVPGQPHCFVHGVGAMPAGIDLALDGRVAGEVLETTLKPDLAYGPHIPELVFTQPRELLDRAAEGALIMGARLQAQTDQGPRAVTVVGIRDDEVLLDANHPLAGMTLRFAIRVVAVREATAEELAAQVPRVDADAEPDQSQD